MTMTHRNSGVVNIINNGKVKWNGHFAGRKEHETPYPRADSTGKHSISFVLEPFDCAETRQNTVVSPVLLVLLRFNE